MKNKKEILILVGYMAVIGLIIWSFAHFNQTEAPEIPVDTVTSTTTLNNVIPDASAVTAIFVKDTPLDIFAKCVTNEGLTMYGAVWCSHCTNEKRAFGESFKYINYVECPDNINLCLSRGINGYPTWVDKNGLKYEGEQGLKGLAKISGCKLP
jgi:hypothetical protein